MMKPVICTIVAKNYLAQARCLTESFLAQHPEGQVFVLLVDRPEDYYDPATEQFTTVLVEEMGISQFKAMSFRYTLLELSTAVKPFFLKYLFEMYKFDALCYFDPDIYFYQPLHMLWDNLQNYRIILTPHLTGPLDEEYNPNELQILRSGTYNLGFIGLARHTSVMEFLDWWADKLTRHCIVDHDRGLFVDQRWVDLVPGRFPKVYIEQDPSYNVAYWNLSHRNLICENDVWLVNETPLKFFHFSGFSPDHADALSKHQNRYNFTDLPHVQPLFRAYREQLLLHGYDNVKTWPNAFARLMEGSMVIPDVARHLWRQLETNKLFRKSFDDAISDESVVPALLAWLNEPVDAQKPLLTHLALGVYQQQPALQQLFPDVLGRDRVAYARWYVSSVEEAFQVDAYFVEAMACSLKKDLRLKAHIYQAFTARLFEIGFGQRLEQLLGEQRVKRIRDFFIPRSPQRATLLQTRSETLIPSSQIHLPSVGINIIGYLSDETGVGENARAIMRALHSHNYPLAWTMVTSHHARQNDRSVLDMPQGHPYDINLFCVNADQIPNVYHELGAAFFEGKYNIGYWFWELENFPEGGLDGLQYFDEIWVGSHFGQKALTLDALVPVCTMGVVIDRMPTTTVTRAQLGLPEDRFIFLFVFDMLSVIERKNPYAVIEAYRRAFAPDFAGVQLVIKVTKLEQFPDHAARLKAEMASIGGILIDRYWDRPELNGLFQACDAYISLHRSEGFGITLAEAMCIGKPVIATDYAGNTDFMNVANSYPIAYTLVALDKDCGPYPIGQRWAEPDIDHAASQMRYVFEHYDEAQVKGQRAATDIAEQYGQVAIARKIITRLKLLSRNKPLN